MAKLTKNSSDRSKDIVVSFNDYLKSINALPVTTNGEPNKTAMAQAAGFDRKRFTTNPKLSQLLDEAIKTIPLQRISNNKDTPEDKRTEDLKRENKRLQSRLVEIQNELHETKKENKIMQKIIKELKQSSEGLVFDFDMLVDTGRMPR